MPPKGVNHAERRRQLDVLAAEGDGDVQKYLRRLDVRNKGRNARSEELRKNAAEGDPEAVSKLEKERKSQRASDARRREAKRSAKKREVAAIAKKLEQRGLVVISSATQVTSRQRHESRWEGESEEVESTGDELVNNRAESSPSLSRITETSTTSAAALHESEDSGSSTSTHEADQLPQAELVINDGAGKQDPNSDEAQLIVKLGDTQREIIEISDDEIGSEHPTSTRGGSGAHQSDRNTARADMERMIELKKRRVQLEKQEIDYELELLALRQGR